MRKILGGITVQDNANTRMTEAEAAARNGLTVAEWREMWLLDDPEEDAQCDADFAALVSTQVDTQAPRLCSQRTPEPHELGEFPMSCYTCHVHADA